jgi:hypothetical protein
MSRANAQVKFPDGTIRYGIYNGTVDVFWPYLFESSEETWSEWDKYYSDMNDYKPPFHEGYESAEGPFLNVEIADDYGGGTTYLGKATKRMIVGATNVDHMIRKGGKPDWWLK